MNAEELRGKFLRLASESRPLANFDDFKTAPFSSREQSSDTSFPDDGIVVEIITPKDTRDPFTINWIKDIDDWLRHHNVRVFKVVCIAMDCDQKLIEFLRRQMRSHLLHSQ